MNIENLISLSNLAVITTGLGISFFTYIFKVRYSYRLRTFDIYRNLIENVHIGDMGGKLFFHFCFYEFKLIYGIVNDEIEKLDIQDRDELCLYIAYEIFMSGILKKEGNNKLNSRICTFVRQNFTLQTDSSAIEPILSKIEERLLEIKKDKRSDIFPTSLYLDKMNRLYSGHLGNLFVYTNTMYEILPAGRASIFMDKNCIDTLISVMSPHEIALLDIAYRFKKIKGIQVYHILGKNKKANEILSDYKKTFYIDSEDFTKDDN